jgi:hypothetical protein
VRSATLTMPRPSVWLRLTDVLPSQRLLIASPTRSRFGHVDSTDQVDRLALPDQHHGSGPGNPPTSGSGRPCPTVLAA